MHPNVRSVLKFCSDPVRVHRHDTLGTSIRTPQDFANAIAFPVERICKCLFLRCSDPERFALALCSSNKTMNISLIAKHLKCAGIRLATPKDLQRHIGYPKKGVSPLGINDCPVFIDAEVLNYDTIVVGAGVVGVEIELSPDDLVALTNPTVLPISYPQQDKI